MTLQTIRVPAGLLALVPLLFAGGATGQALPGDTPDKADTETVTVAPAKTSAGANRAFGVLPNYRTAEGRDEFKPLTTKQKFHIAWKDSTDWPVFPTAAFYTTIYHAQNQNPSFGQGVGGYAHRYICAYADQVLGNYFMEAIIPTALHHDPRYFRKGEGPVGRRMGYALSRLIVSRTDSGRATFNVSEFAGNGAQVAIANLYYPDTRTLSQNMSRMAFQVGIDGLNNMVREFWPDIHRKLGRRKQKAKDTV